MAGAIRLNLPGTCDDAERRKRRAARAGAAGPTKWHTGSEAVEIGSAGTSRRFVLAALALLCVAWLCLSLPGAALADVWVDIPDSTWQSTYGVSAEDAAGVAQGRSDGTFGPRESVNRGQFAKMTTSGLDVSGSAPQAPSFSDVPEGHVFFCQVEGCAAAGLISGYSDGTFHPTATVTRQQTCSVLGRWLAEREIVSNGGIVGKQGTYPTLRAWYTAEGPAYLTPFADAGAVSQAHQPGAAYLVYRGVVRGSSSGFALHLRPTVTLNRAQAVALVLRAREVELEITRPVITSVDLATGLPTGGEMVTIRGRGLGAATQVRFGETPAASFSVVSPLEITVVAPAHAPGIVEVQVVTPGGATAPSGAGVYTYAWDGTTSVVLTQGQTPLKGVWRGTAEQLASYLLGIEPLPLFTVATEELAGYYVRYCAEAGLRADLLWAQMIHETGYGRYGGDVLPEQNNYAGIGATGGVPGYTFATPEAGVMAQVAHMIAYVYVDSPVEWADSATDPRFDLVCPRGMAVVLADLNGRWAVPGTTYGQSIEAIARAINGG